MDGNEKRLFVGIMRNRILYGLLCLPLWLPVGVKAQSGETITVGAKHFNEGYILGEIIALVLEDAGFRVDRKFNLGGTAVTFEGLRNDVIDVYPEYTGTISAEILKLQDMPTLEQQREMVKEGYGLEISEPYGFNNTYALLMKEDMAAELGISKISDLQDHPSLRFGLSYEFLERQDGWGVLSSYYRLPQQPTGPCLSGDFKKQYRHHRRLFDGWRNRTI